MIVQCSNELEIAYTNLYRNLRNYIWEFSTVEKLVELEISIYKAFPDRDTIKNNLSSLYYDIKETLKEDEDLRDSYEKLKTIIESDETFYSKLDKVNEVIQ